MFHAEKLKYAPLKGNRLLYIGDDEELMGQLSAYCHSFEISFRHSSQEEEWSDLISEHTFHYVLVEQQKVEKAGAKLKNGPVRGRMVLIQEEESRGDAEHPVVILSREMSGKDSALKILDKVLALKEVPPEFSDEMEKVDFGYLQETFAGQEERYRDLLEMMQAEFAAVKREIDLALQQNDLERFRENKHKIQPSANYLQMKDLVNLMEQLKWHFYQRNNPEYRKLAPKMMRYFDSVLSALQKELGA